MNSSKVILDKIINDNNAIIEQNLKQANEQATEIVAKAETDAEAKVAARKAGLQADYDEIIRRSVVVAELDAKKVLMNAKAKAIDNLFAKTADKLCQLDTKKYLAIIEKILKKYAENGDIVIICANDKDKITKKFIDDVATKLGIKLALSNEVGNFNGGLILSGANSDKNLSFDMELLAIREECETQIANMLFEEKSSLEQKESEIVATVTSEKKSASKGTRATKSSKKQSEGK